MRLVKGKKIFLLFLFLLLISSFLSFNTVNAQEEECDKKKVTVIAKDQDGNYVPANFLIYRQVEDVDGNPKPGAKVTSGQVSSILGRGESEFSDKDGFLYCAELKGPKTGESYWIYDELQIGCGGSGSVTFYMSGINFILRDMNEDLLRNQDFMVYTQAYDADNNPVKQKDRYIGKFNTKESGSKTIYVPSGVDNIEGEGVDDYVLEIKNINGGYFTEYGIDVDPGDMTKEEYYISDMKLNFKNYEGIAFPGGTKVEIYKQKLDVDNNKVLGDRIKIFYTDDEGVVLFAYPEETCAAKLIGDDSQSQIFWGLEIDEEERSDYTLKTSSSWVSSFGACEEESELKVITEDLKGLPVSGMNFVLYKQISDSNGYPVAGDQVLKGEIGETGFKTSTIHPNPLFKYALKIYDENPDEGDFWYYYIRFECGENKTITKYLPEFNFVLRDGDGTLLKNKNFSVYTQKIDIDGSPIKEKDTLLTKLNTSEEGTARLYLASDHEYDDSKKGIYAFVSEDNDFEYVAYDIQVTSDKDINFEYVFSDLAVKLKDSTNNSLGEKSIDLYEQKLNIQGDKVLGEKLIDAKTDSEGEFIINHPSGNFALVTEDDLGGEYVFYDVSIEAKKRSYKTIQTNTTRVRANVPSDYRGNPDVLIYNMKEDTSGRYYRDGKGKKVEVRDVGYYDIVLRPGPYLFVLSYDKMEYGKTLYTENGKLQEITINVNANDYITSSDLFYLNKPEPPMTLAEKLKGNILLQVEENGEAWYVNTTDKKRYYMKDGEVAYEMMRSFGLGIKNEDLKKIPIGFDTRFDEEDFDNDNLPDKMEEALGTNLNSPDSDGDGFDDDLEVRNNFNPLGDGKLPIDEAFTEKLKGKILLQVEERGQAWYVNPDDGKRYYMKDGESAYKIMRFLSLGITNQNLSQIPIGNID